MALDPDIDAALARLAADPSIGLDQFQGDALTIARLETTSVRGAGNYPITLRIYQPETKETPAIAACILFLHGGGWVGGSLGLYDKPARRLASETGSPVAVVDYRLAPDFPYPAALFDSVVAYQELLQRFQGGVSVFGDSAGANLALGLSLYLRDQGMPMPGRLCLFYPPLDPWGRSHSYKTYADAHLLSADRMRACWRAYSSALGYHQMPYACFIESGLQGLPRTQLFVAEHDILRDEGVKLGHNLIDRGVDVSIEILKDLPHAALHFCGVSPNAEMLYKKSAEFLNR